MARCEHVRHVEESESLYRSEEPEHGRAGRFSRSLPNFDLGRWEGKQ